MTKAEKQIDKIMNDNNLEYGYKLDFPRYRKIPEEVLLALAVMKKHEMNVVIVLKKKGEE